MGEFDRLVAAEVEAIKEAVRRELTCTNCGSGLILEAPDGTDRFWCAWCGTYKTPTLPR